MGKGLVIISNEDGAGIGPSFPSVKAPLPIHCWKHLLHMNLNPQRKAPQIEGKNELADSMF